MNISSLTIYLWQLADNVQTAAFILASLAGGLGIFLWYAWLSEGIEDAKNASLLSGFFFSVFLSAAVFIPSSKTIAMMVVIPEIAHSKVVQQDLPDIYNAAVKALKDQLTK